jgi:hypothetical protein
MWSSCGPTRRVAARIWDCLDLGAVPDNFKGFKGLVNIEAGGHLLELDPGTPVALKIHSPTLVTGRVTVKNHLTTLGGYDDFVAFLNALSAETDPCAGTSGGLAIANAAFDNDTGNETTTVNWTTNFPAECFLTATMPDASTTTFLTAPGLNHEVTYDYLTTGAVSLEITSELRLCDVTAAPAALMPFEFYGWSADTDLECTESTVKWDLTAPVACLFEWGPKNRQGNYAYTLTTPAGYHHELNLPADPGGRYMARITPQVAGAVSVVKYWNAYPCALQPPGKDLPQVAVGLQSISPNPFNPATTIAFGVAEAGQVRIRIYDLAGRLVRTLADEVYPVGNHELMWNGRDGRGRGVASGTYLVRFEAAELQEVKRIALLK